MNKKIILIILIVGFSLTMSFFGMTAYVYQQPNDLLTINYVCTTGLKPHAFTAYRSHDNGTHTIDVDSCGWIKNTNYKLPSIEFDEIHGMSCDEIRDRYNSGEPYQNKENQLFAQERFVTCNFILDFAKSNMSKYAEPTRTP